MEFTAIIYAEQQFVSRQFVFDVAFNHIQIISSTWNEIKKTVSRYGMWYVAAGSRTVAFGSLSS